MSHLETAPVYRSRPRRPEARPAPAAAPPAAPAATRSPEMFIIAGQCAVIGVLAGVALIVAAILPL